MGDLLANNCSEASLQWIVFPGRACPGWLSPCRISFEVVDDAATGMQIAALAAEWRSQFVRAWQKAAQSSADSLTSELLALLELLSQVSPTSGVGLAPFRVVCFLLQEHVSTYLA